MSDRANLVRVLTAATGTSTMTLGAAYSQLFMTPAEANMVDGRTYTYLIVDGNNWELGKGVYTASGTTLSRVTVLASRISGTLGTTKITLSGTAQVRIIESADDMGALRGTRAVTGTSDPLVQTDLDRAVTYSNAAAIAVSLAQAGASSSFLDGWCVWVQNLGAGVVTITPATSTINGAATLPLAQNLGAFIWSDGTNYHAYYVPITKPLLAANNLSELASAATARGNLGIRTLPQGRLTLQTLVPVMTTSQAAKTTLYYTPYQGDECPIYDGTNMVPTVFSELSVAITDTTKSPAAIGASKVNDWFVWNDAGTVRLSHGPDWTNDTTRSAGTALVMVNGILLNNAAITNGPAASRGTYVGTTRSNASSQLDFGFGSAGTGGGAAFFGLWNMYNRVNVTTTVTDTGVSYSYTSSTIRQARGSAGNQISFVTGLVEEAFSADVVIFGFIVAVAGAFIHFGVGLNSTTTFASAYSSLSNNTAGSTFFQSLPNHCSLMPQLGLNVISSNQSGDNTNANSFDAGSTDVLTCLVRM